MSSPIETYEQASFEHYSLYMQNGEIGSIARAVQYAQDAVNLTPERDPNRAERLGNLGFFLSTRFEREGKLDDLNKASNRVKTQLA